MGFSGVFTCGDVGVLLRSRSLEQGVDLVSSVVGHDLEVFFV